MWAWMGAIAAIGDLAATPTALRLDAGGCAVAPGFIDPHTHSDLALLLNPEAHSKIRQGVTTEVIGNCGSTPAPVVGPFVAEIKARSGCGGSPRIGTGRPLPSTSIACAPPGHRSTSCRWRATSRCASPPWASRTGPAAEELARMHELLAEALDAGAFGMSSGLMTPPSSYADTEELVALAGTLRARRAVFSRVSGEGKTLFRATAEAIEFGERAGVPVQIAHHKAASRSNWGRMPRVTQLSEWAVDRDVDVRFDVYPYTAGSAGLTQLLPDWAHEGGRGAARPAARSGHARPSREDSGLRPGAGPHLRHHRQTEANHHLEARRWPRSPTRGRRAGRGVVRRAA